LNGLRVPIWSIFVASKGIEDDVNYTIANDIAGCMNYLHSQGPPIIHSRLCLANVLVADSMSMTKVKILNAGFIPCFNGTPDQQASRSIATEVLTGAACSKSSDVFSYGCLPVFIFARRFPDKAVQKILHVPNGLPSHLLPEIREIITCCLESDPLAQPTWTDILRNLEACPRQVLEIALLVVTLAEQSILPSAHLVLYSLVRSTVA